MHAFCYRTFQVVWKFSSNYWDRIEFIGSMQELKGVKLTLESVRQRCPHPSGGPRVVHYCILSSPEPPAIQRKLSAKGENCSTKVIVYNQKVCLDTIFCLQISQVIGQKPIKTLINPLRSPVRALNNLTQKKAQTLFK